MEECPGRACELCAVRRELYAEIADETAFVAWRQLRDRRHRILGDLHYGVISDPCFGARTLIPRRFTETSIFSAGFADCGRP